MRIPHRILAAATGAAVTIAPVPAAVAFLLAVSGPAEAQRYVLVRQAPEFPRGTTAEGAQDGPNETHRTTLSGGRAVTEYYSCGPGDHAIWGTATFDEPPERIDLETEESRTVSLKARADLSGALHSSRIIGPGARGLRLAYGADSAYGRNFSDRRLSLSSGQFEQVGRQTNCSGSESLRWEGDLKQEITAVLHVTPRQTSGFAIVVTVQGAGGQLQVRYPYTLEEVPDEPEVAGGIFPDADAWEVCTLPMPGDVDTLSVTPMPGGVEPIDFHAIRDVPPDVIADWIEDYMERNPQMRASQLRAIMELLDLDVAAAREIMREQLHLFSSPEVQAAIRAHDTRMAGAIVSLEIARWAGVAASTALAPALVVKTTGALITRAAAWNAGRVATLPRFKYLSKTAQLKLKEKAKAAAAAAVLGFYTLPALAGGGYKLWGSHYEREGERLGDPRLKRLGKSYQQVGGLLGKTAGIVKAPTDPTAWLEGAAELAKAHVTALEAVCEDEDDPTLARWRAIAEGLSNTAAVAGFWDPTELLKIERDDEPDKFRRYAQHIASKFIEDRAKDGPAKLQEQEIETLLRKLADDAQTQFDRAMALTQQMSEAMAEEDAEQR